MIIKKALASTLFFAFVSMQAAVELTAVSLTLQAALDYEEAKKDKDARHEEYLQKAFVSLFNHLNEDEKKDVEENSEVQRIFGATRASYPKRFGDGLDEAINAGDAKKAGELMRKKYINPMGTPKSGEVLQGLNTP